MAFTELRAAARQALEALECGDSVFYPKTKVAIEALRAALAEPVQEPDPGEYHGWVLREVLFDNGEPVGHREPVQEPVAWRFKAMIGMPWSLSDDGYYISCKRDQRYFVEALYTAPPQRKPLDDLAIADIYTKWDATPGTSMADFARAIERAHGITGDNT